MLSSAAENTCLDQTRKPRRPPTRQINESNVITGYSNIPPINPAETKQSSADFSLRRICGRSGPDILQHLDKCGVGIKKRLPIGDAVGQLYTKGNCDKPLEIRIPSDPAM
jgi:hypothetical protein